MKTTKYSDGSEVDIVLCITTETYTSGDYGHFRIRPAYLEDDSNARLCNGKLAGLEVTAQFNLHNFVGSDTFVPYGTEVGFSHMRSVDLESAKNMVRVLGAISRKLERYNKDWGRVLDSDIGGFVVRFAKALGAKAIITSLKPNPNSGYVHQSDVTDARMLVGFALEDAKQGKWTTKRRYS